MSGVDDPDRPVVQLERAGKRYSWSSRWVLRDVDLGVAPGRVIEVRGANGAGKSTLLRMVAGAVLPTRGRRRALAGLTVGYAPERLAPAPPFTAAAYLDHHARVRGLRGDRAGDAQRTRLVGSLGLGGLVHERLSALSKGSLQKVVAVQAFLGAPGIVVLDEPFSGLDADASRALCELIERAAAGGAAVLFSDHRESERRPAAHVRWTLSPEGVHEQRLDRPDASPAVAIDELAAVAERARASGRPLTVSVRAGDSDRALAALLASGWHVVSVRAGRRREHVTIEAVDRRQ